MEGGRTRRLLDFVYDAASARDMEQFRFAVTVGIRRVIGADLASYTEVELESGTVIAPLDPEISAEDAIAAFGRLVHQHPLVTRANGAAETISDHLSIRRFHALELYDEVYRRLGAEDQLAISLLPAGGRVQIGLALNRGRRTFTVADRQALDLLRPELIKAYRRVLELERRKAASLSIGDTSDLTPRQQEILALVAQGTSNQQVAGQLGISRRTVENHLHAAYLQLGVTNRTAAAAAVQP